jgi:hypothetical protein
MMMHLYEEKDYQAVATALGCSLSAIKALMFRAHETLRIRLRYIAADEASAECGVVTHYVVPKPRTIPARNMGSIAA